MSGISSIKENIKKKFSNVIKEGIHIGENISTQFSRVHSPTFDPSNDPELGIPSEINVAAGAEVLQEYEDAWKSVNEANDQNVKAAANIKQTIDRLQQRIKARQVNMNDLLTCLAGLPLIEANLKASLNKFSEIEELSRVAEDKIADLNDVCNMLEKQEKTIKENLEAKRKEMAAFEAQQQKEAAEKREQIRQDEERLKRFQKERQAAFDEAFRGDIEEYKKTGAVKKIELNRPSTFSLEEIDLQNDEAEDALEDFLNG